MTTMIERVARAMENALDVLSYEDAARAAIEAMREPSEAMIMTQGRSKPENARTDTQRRLAEDLNRSVRQMAVTQWQEMIDAALKEIA